MCVSRTNNHLVKMLYSSEKYGEPLVATIRLFSILIIILCLSTEIITIPTPTQDYPNYTTDNLTELAENTTNDDLYIIRAVVYEIGVLTDTDNTTDENPERREEVNISIYNPPHQDNGLLDLNKVPISTENTLNTEESTEET
ncbi:PREDICTED: uncharacterized protein LOC107067216 [Polistes dominula]|uniref:Uncharacterized protein LOC107067216 n=1 Tax=Polistes dominula TaxID=743375 RepID=A0ABM1ICS4_POLDO|nr:PREDICTED: uncharacterized protein LOC107067216 [Polistes dominula]XP_015178012.1 PREDICTED: uncharacterized protein LOC107067216 [Polistes dominula]